MSVTTKAEKALAEIPDSSTVPELAKDVGWLMDRLPEVTLKKPHREPDYYGASILIARAVGLPFAPISRSSWFHGWPPSKLWESAPHLEPEAIFGSRDPRGVNLMFTTAQVAYLKNSGWTGAEACGAPFIYAQPSGVERVEGSLLVMPPHVTACTSQDWDEQAYVDQIAEIRSEFSRVVACVSGFCVAKGYWTKAFEKIGVPWITGASTHDRNALNRMRTMFDSFEFVTTPKLGSHLPYAGYCGCKISLYGVDMPSKKEHFANDPMRQRYPEGLDLALRETSTEVIKRRFPFLLVDPGKGMPALDWARDELGEENKRPAEEMARLLGWSWRPGEDEDYLRHFLHSGTGRVARRVYGIERAMRKLLGRK